MPAAGGPGPHTDNTRCTSIYFRMATQPEPSERRVQRGQNQGHRQHTPRLDRETRVRRRINGIGKAAYGLYTHIQLHARAGSIFFLEARFFYLQPYGSVGFIAHAVRAHFYISFITPVEPHTVHMHLDKKHCSHYTWKHAHRQAAGAGAASGGRRGELRRGVEPRLNMAAGREHESRGAGRLLVASCSLA